MATEPARAPAPQPNSVPATTPRRRPSPTPTSSLQPAPMRGGQPAVQLSPSAAAPTPTDLSPEAAQVVAAPRARGAGAPARSAVGGPAVRLGTTRRPVAAPASLAERIPARPSGGAAPAGRPAQIKVVQATRDPRFQQALRRLDASAVRAGSHPPAAKKAAEAQAAALPPANERLAGAKAGSVEAMQAAETGKPENTSFLAMLRAEIQKVMPKKTEDVGEFMQGDDKDRLKGAMTGNIGQQKAQATGAVHAASTTPPDPSRVPGKEVTPLPDDRPPAPTPIDAGSAMPAPQPPAAVSLEQGKQDADRTIKDAELTTPQLQKANDPRFSAVLTAKTEVDKKADSLPQQFRAGEQRTIAEAVAKAQGDERAGVGALAGQQRHSGAAVHAHQLTARQKDEQERKKVADTIEQYYTETKLAVDKKLERLDKEVEQVFDDGTEAAINKMKDYVETRFDDRYSGISGKALWLKDKFWPLPDEVKIWFDEAHTVFLAEMDALVVRVANLVETRLREAKDEIRKGERRIADFVKGLRGSLQSVGRAAQQEMSGRFEELRRGVDDKKSDLAEKLAQRYKDAHEKGATALQDLKDAHKSLVEKLKEFVEKVVKVLREFKDRIVSMLKKSKDTISLIISDPIGFLGNLLSAIKQGISQFVDRIWDHLREGFIEWLFGSLAEAGIVLPKDFSLPSILKLVLAVLGVTYEKIRAKAVKLIGERNVALVERAAALIKELVTGGPARLWEMIKESFANLKEMLTGEILSWLIGEIIKAAVTKLISMFNPVGAIIQAILMIYRTVMFFIERINQILDFVQAIIESVSKIAHGDIGDAANWIEQALARAIPLIIAFLARLLGISGITDKIKRIIHKLQSKVDQAIDKVVEKIVGGIGKLFGGGKDKPGSDHDKQLQAGLQALDSLTASYDKEEATKEKLEQGAASVKSKHPVFKTLSVKDEGDEFVYDYTASPGSSKHGPKKGTYSVGIHKVAKPGTTKASGDSHHVPAKVLKRWIGEIYEIAGKITGNNALKARGAAYKTDNIGEGLSAIWLSDKAHKQAHEPSETEPEDMKASKSEILITTQTGIVSATPKRATLTSSIHEQVIDTEESKAKTREAQNREIYKAKAKRLKSLFQKVFNGLLFSGIEMVKRAKLADNKWVAKITATAKETWATILDPKADD